MIPATIYNQQSYFTRKQMMRRYLGELDAPPIVIRDAALLLVEATCAHSKVATIGFILRHYFLYWRLEKQSNIHRWWMSLRGKQEAL